MKLSDMSSQELERLFDNARIKGAEGGGEESDAESGDATDEGEANTRLHVTLDTDDAGQETVADAPDAAVEHSAATIAEDDAQAEFTVASDVDEDMDERSDDSAPTDDESDALDSSALDEIPEELRLYEQLMRDANGAGVDAESTIDDGDGDPFDEDEDEDDDNPLDHVDEDEEEDDESEFADDDSDTGGDPFARDEEEFANGIVEADIEVENPFDEDAPDEDEEQR
jgi:hypothetical protein